MIFIGENKPVVLDYTNTAAKTITTATLKTSIGDSLTQVDVFECDDCCDGKVWTAVFDPNYFNESDTYQILWEGTDVNDTTLEDLETGISIKYTNDFYSGFLKFLKQSILDDTESCTYSVDSMLNAIDYANCFINNQPPFTNCPPDQQPCSILLDLAKVQLYKSRAGREAGETFTYNDIGKSFSYDVSGKLLQIAESLERTAMDALKAYKRNLRPVMKGIMSRYARRAGRGARAMFIDRTVFRAFIR